MKLIALFQGSFHGGYLMKKTTKLCNSEEEALVLLKEAVKQHNVEVAPFKDDPKKGEDFPGGYPARKVQIEPVLFVTHDDKHYFQLNVSDQAESLPAELVASAKVVL